MDLSILIPSRNEEWLAETLTDLIRNIRGSTEIIAVIDGEKFHKDLPINNDVLKVIQLKESIGQRAATNLAAREAKGTYIMKVDAHCAFAKGFDLAIIKAFDDLGDNITQVPIMRNLHVFDWVCERGHRRYQSPSGPCTQCAQPTKKELIWHAKHNPASTSYRFDHTLHFQYFRSWKQSDTYKEQIKSGYTETMSLQGSCFALHKDKYWSLNICDESFGSWGQQGVEVACKTWLSGGRVICNHHTWYGHLFRTQGGDFGFPYKHQPGQLEKARELSRRLFLDNTWPQQKYPLVWLIDKFSPVPNWHDGNDDGMYQRVKEWGDRWYN